MNEVWIAAMAVCCYFRVNRLTGCFTGPARPDGTLQGSCTWLLDTWGCRAGVGRSSEWRFAASGSAWSRGGELTQPGKGEPFWPGSGEVSQNISVDNMCLENISTEFLNLCWQCVTASFSVPTNGWKQWNQFQCFGSSRRWYLHSDHWQGGAFWSAFLQCCNIQEGSSAQENALCQETNSWKPILV